MLVTVSAMVVVALTVPLVPVMVTLLVPAVAVLDAVNVTVLVPVVEAGLKLAVTPLGKPLAASATVPVKPLDGLTVIVLLAVPPWATETLVGFAASVKVGVVPVTVKAMVALWVRFPLVPTIEILVVPDGVFDCPLKLMLMVPLPLTELGLKLALTPEGRFVADTDTVPVKPNNAATVTEAVGLDPGVSVTEAGGLAVIEKSGRPTMVRVSSVDCVIEPLVPVTVMVTGEVGTGALAAAVKVSVLTPSPLAILGELKAAVTPVGKPLTVRATVPANLFTGRTVIAVLPVAPCSTLVPLPETLKLGLVVVGIGGKAFCTSCVNSVAKNCPAGGELAMEPVRVFPANGFVLAGLQFGSAWTAPSWLALPG